MAPSLFYAAIFVSLSVAAIAQSLPKPDGISVEMYCLGCEVTMKELDKMLQRKPTRGMGETVTRALDRVCDKDNFNRYDYDSKKLVKVCNHIINDEGLEAVLIADYGRKHATGHETSYLEMTKKICTTHLHACQGAAILGDEEGGGISYNSETEQFLVRDGSKVRTVKPVREGSPPEKKVEPDFKEFESLEKEAAKLHYKESHDEL